MTFSLVEMAMNRALSSKANFRVIVCCVAVIALGQSLATAAPKEYDKSSDVSGTLISKGSDTMSDLMNLWSDAFKKLHPNVTFEIESKGSNSAPRALSEGTATLGPMSREIEPEEADDFEAKHGFKPTRVDVALD